MLFDDFENVSNIRYQRKHCVTITYVLDLTRAILTSERDLHGLLYKSYVDYKKS